MALFPVTRKLSSVLPTKWRNVPSFQRMSPHSPMTFGTCRKRSSSSIHSNSSSKNSTAGPESIICFDDQKIRISTTPLSCLKAVVESRRHRERQNWKALFDPTDSIVFIYFVHSVQKSTSVISVPPCPASAGCGSKFISGHRLNGVV